MLRTAYDVSDYTRQQRIRAVHHILASPHRYTVDDLAFSEREFDMSVADVARIFYEAPSLIEVPHPKAPDSPLYLGCIDIHGYIHTLSHSDLDKYKRHMTICLTRFMREGGGHEMMQGAWGWADRADLESGEVQEHWARQLGFEPHDELTLRDQTFVRFRYSGAAAQLGN